MKRNVRGNRAVYCLPLEILEITFSYLEPEEIRNGSLVCKRWKEILYQKKFWRWAVLIISRVGRKNDCRVREVLNSEIFALVECIDINWAPNNDLIDLFSLMAESEICRGKELTLSSLVNVEVVKPEDLGIVVTKMRKVTLWNPAHLNSIFDCVTVSIDLLLKSISFEGILFSKDICDPERMAIALCRLSEASFISSYLPTDFLSELLTVMVKCTNVTLRDLWLQSLSEVSNRILIEAKAKFKIHIDDEYYSSGESSSDESSLDVSSIDEEDE